MTRSYQYSPSGNITSKGTEHGTYTYQYDELYRLISAVNPTISDEAYTYDAIGNRLTSSDTTELWSYNENNELNAHNGVTYEYDDNGNMIQKSIGGQDVHYIYDIEDRLVQVEDGDGVVATYYYDPFGRRLWKEVDGTRTYFLYSDEGLIGEYDASGNEIKTYGYAPDSLWTTDPLFQKIGDYYYFYQNDHQGTPQKLIGTNGLVVWAGVYDSFGNCQIEVEGITNNLRFPGQYYDEETGLHYNWDRYYDTTTARYLRTDPYGDGLNLYAYVLNNPINWIDPWGLCARTDKLRFDGTNILWIRDQGHKVRVRMYPGISGPWGKGRLPEGSYSGTNLRTRTNSGMTCPGKKIGWSLDLEPNFETARKNLRIHPDGGDYVGTRGCIGVSCDSSDRLYNDLRDYFDVDNSSIPVEVRYWCI